MLRSRLWSFLCLLLLAASAPVSAQSVRLLDCPALHFFAPACPPAAALEPMSPPPPPEEFPLFPPATLARDVPPIFVRLLDDPSEENARAYLAWQAERAARTQEVQDLIKRLTTEEK